MSYQSKTTVVCISVGDGTNKRLRFPLTGFSAAHAAAVLIASRCQMDIISITPYSTGYVEECCMTVVYTNNGRSLNNIRTMMIPEMEKEHQNWSIQNLDESEGLLECIVNVIESDDE